MRTYTVFLASVEGGTAPNITASPARFGQPSYFVRAVLFLARVQTFIIYLLP
eukprot:COSAG02_NODE_29819_length_562_cov_0.976242_1_plen_51_part_01